MEENPVPQTSTPPAPAHNIRTFQSDVEEIIKSGEGSLAKIAIAENQKRVQGNYVPNEPETPPRGRLMLVGSLVLILLGLGTVSALYFFKKNPEQGNVNPVLQAQPLIATDLIKKINVSGLEREAIIKTLSSEIKNNTASLSSVVGLQLTEGTGNATTQIETEVFLKKLDSRAPSELVRSLSETFMFGIHVLNVNQPFLILKTSYYQNAFAGMLSWEATLKEDLGAIFSLPTKSAVASTSDQILAPASQFEDMVVKNRDTRVIRDTSGKVIFLYSFPNKNTIIVTTNSDTLEKISARLLAGKLVQ